MSFHHIDRLGVVVLAGGLAFAATGAQAQDKSTISDAQVEANVLRQLATASDLSSQNIQSTTVYGTVTLSGNVHDETLRSKAENLAARAEGVKKVVDELTLGDTPAATADNNGDAQQQGAPANDPGSNSGNNNNNMVLQSDGTYAPAQSGDQNQQPAPPAQAENNQPPQPGYDNGAPQPNGPPPQPGYNNNGAPQPYGQPGQPPPARRPMYSNNYASGSPNGGPYAGQRAGLQVTVPGGAALQVRINRGLDSNNVQPGTPFTGVVMNDVVANGSVAIPRGASIQGTVVDAKRAGVLKGRGELSLQLTSLTLGGQVYPLATNAWGQAGRDKTTGTVNSAIGLGALGAIVGAVAGGGAGAAIGAGVGGAAGVAGSAASPNGRVIVPPESVLTFTLAQPATITTVSQQEMARLSYAAGSEQHPVVYGPGPYPYYGPVYYRPY